MVAATYSEARLTSSSGVTGNVLMRSSLYYEFLAEREEILKHKWIESEKAGYDIGFERALVDWMMKYRSDWRESRRRLGALENLRGNGR